jgi:DNA-directed RNA polymerase III subunit RPC6
LLQCTQSLVDRKLFRVLEGRENHLAWKLISQEDAERYVQKVGQQRILHMY